METRFRHAIESGGTMKVPDSVEELLVFTRMMIADRAPKNRYNSLVITKLEEAELLWMRGRGLA